MTSIHVEFTFHGNTCDVKISCEDGITIDDLVDLFHDLIDHIEEEANLQ